MLEILIITVIVGVIAVIMITTIKPRDLEVGYMYLSAFTFLKDASDNIYLDSQQVDAEFPMTSIALCNAMAGYINTTHAPSCGNAGSIPFSTGTFSSSWNPVMVASNNMRIYISTPGVINGEKYIKIWVDLNGERKPNTSTWKEGSPADVVAFLVNSNADLIIVGPPLFDTRYVWGRIHYTTDEEGKGTYSKKLPFYQAQYRAFNGLQVNDDPFSINVNSYMNGDLKVPANKMPIPTVTQYDRDMCGFITGQAYSVCTVQLLN